MILKHNFTQKFAPNAARSTETAAFTLALETIITMAIYSTRALFANFPFHQPHSPPLHMRLRFLSLSLCAACADHIYSGRQRRLLAFPLLSRVAHPWITPPIIFRSGHTLSVCLSVGTPARTTATKEFYHCLF